VPRLVLTFPEPRSTLRPHGLQAQSAVSRSGLSPSFAKAAERAGVMNRDDRREAIFRDDQDRLLFLDTLGEARQKTDWQIHAWCVMSNHFHLVVETPWDNLVVGMTWKNFVLTPI